MTEICKIASLTQFKSLHVHIDGFNPHYGAVKASAWLTKL